MLSYPELISTINGDPGNLWPKFREVADAKRGFFLAMFMVYPLFGPLMWAVMAGRVMIAIVILVGMYSLPLPFIFKMARANKLWSNMLENHWLPKESCYVFSSDKLKWVIILTSSLVGVEIFLIFLFVIHTSYLSAILLALLSVGMGVLFILMNDMNCKNGVSVVRVVKFDTPGTIANMIAMELNTEAKKIMGNSTFKIDLPQSGRSLTIYRMEKNKDKVWLTISSVTEKNLYQTKEMVDKINAVLEKI